MPLQINSYKLDPLVPVQCVVCQEENQKIEDPVAHQIIPDGAAPHVLCRKCQLQWERKCLAKWRPVVCPICKERVIPLAKELFSETQKKAMAIVGGILLVGAGIAIQSLDEESPHNSYAILGILAGACTGAVLFACSGAFNLLYDSADPVDRLDREARYHMFVHN